MIQNLWSDKIPYLKISKNFFKKINYKGINLWPIMAPEIYTYYKAPEKVWWMRPLMGLKNLFTLDKFPIEGGEKNIFASYIMARDDHRILVKNALSKFSKDELTILDACEYKKKKSPLKFSYRFPNLILLFKIWRKFKKANMKDILKNK